MKITLRFILFVIFASATILEAQGGSVYTRQGIGDNIYSNSSRRQSLGGLGFAAMDSYNISSTNPAGWANLNLTRVEIGINYNGIQLDDGTNSKYFSNYSFSGFSVGLPISSDNGSVASFGLMPVSNVNYDVKTENLASGLLGDNYSSFEYKGTGGLSKFYMGLSYKMPFDFILGATFEYYTGKIDYNSNLVFDVNSSYSDISYIQKKSYHGIGSSFGLISSDFSNLLNSDKIENLKLALYFNYVDNLTTDTSLVSSTSIGTITKEKGIAQTKIPYKFGLGASFTWDKNYLILFDYLYQPWSKYEFNGKTSSSLKDLQKVVLSMEYSDSERRFNTSFWDNLVFRLGFGYEQTQYVINGENIDKLSIFAGMAFPLGIGNTLDCALEYGMRGKTGNGLVKENIINANFTINFGELWFMRQDR